MNQFLRVFSSGKIDLKFPDRLGEISMLSKTELPSTAYLELFKPTPKGKTNSYTTPNGFELGRKIDISMYGDITYKCANCAHLTPITAPVYSFFNREIADWWHVCCSNECFDKYCTKTDITGTDTDTIIVEKLHKHDKDTNRGFHEIYLI